MTLTLYKFFLSLLISGSVAFLTACSSTSYQAKKEVYLFSYFTGNGEDGLHLAYSLDGYQFKPLENGNAILTPTAGEDKLMRDPCIVKGRDGRFHMVWTVSWNEKGLGYAYSDDLVQWSEQQFIPVMAQEPNARNTWAPEVFYDKKEDLYLIYWSTTISGRYPETQSQEEDGYNHRQYYVTTKDFETFSETRLFYEPGFNVIDGTIQEINGEYLLFVKDETREPPRKNIRIAKSQKLTGPYGPAGAPITGDYWAEGPTVAKVGDYWLVYFDKYIEKDMGAVMSSDLENWIDISNRINFPEGSRHGTVFKVDKTFFDKLPFAR
ncbi:glycoside hydrolase family 43 protein [Cyclobacterium jeungdonense]|uniref:Glycoside hydrolase family 43 protein n=1 Tax=Cyclobacterium jeungdonense TaxID=708087 RepID=A0ABT8C6G7_9BACT|nr:glycoside hydrolase family 43 protein [Cyclobacterium jeungdonense]MDN3687936.1 glycoside hydrolase family 43 protein [Cyclobacterium jeungdonense]